MWTVYCTKHCERIQRFRETGSLKHLYRNELDKACFAHDVAYSDNKDLAKRTVSDKILKDRAYKIARNPKYNGYQSALASMVYKLLDKKTGLRASADEELAGELHKPVIKKFKRRRVYARFKDNIWAFDLAEMESLSSKNQGVKPLKDKKGRIGLNDFKETVNESNRKPNKLWVDQGRDFYNKFMREWFDDNDILMYSTYNERK